MRAARCTLIGSHLGGGFSPFAGFPPELLRWLACVLDCTVRMLVDHVGLRVVLVPYRPYVS
eukprot:853602-Prymnesium_polylepis.1